MPAVTVPFIPDNAPFTAEQRAWLNGFLAGIFSSAPAPAGCRETLRRSRLPCSMPRSQARGRPGAQAHQGT